MKTKNALNDIPPARFFFGSRIWIGRFSVEANATFQMEKNDPGPAEIKILSHKAVNIKATYLFDSSFRFYLALSNIFNFTYLARPDPDSIEESGRNLSLGISYAF